MEGDEGIEAVEAGVEPAQLRGRVPFEVGTSGVGYPAVGLDDGCTGPGPAFQVTLGEDPGV